MALDFEEMEVLLQRRYNCLYEIHRLTKEMLDMIPRGDEISLSLMMDMRGEEIEKYEVCQKTIWKKSEKGPQEAEQVRRIMTTDPDEGLATAKTEEKLVYQIRKKTVNLIREVQQLDRQLGLRIHAGRPR